MRHGCWEGSCLRLHLSYDEYADSPDHTYPKRGSAGFSVDRQLVWALVQGPLSREEPDQRSGEQWLVLDAEDGRVLSRAATKTAAEGSVHVPHPTDPVRWV